jgi:hypothetical protein
MVTEIVQPQISPPIPVTGDQQRSQRSQRTSKWIRTDLRMDFDELNVLFTDF